jgi:Domain of unknown function (DUF4390)
MATVLILLQRLPGFTTVGLAAILCVWLQLLAPISAARAQGVETTTLELHQEEGYLTVEFSLRATLPRGVEEALQRGVPVYFTAQASLFRSRWYWRDERIARVSRQWRVIYQPLTDSWRVGIGALTQSVATLQEAMSLITRTSGWRIAELSSIEPGARHYVEFSFKLDSSQLPAPMLVGLTTQTGWQMSLDRTLPFVP